MWVSGNVEITWEESAGGEILNIYFLKNTVQFKTTKYKGKRMEKGREGF